MSDHLFPRRLTRRDFVKIAALASAGLALPSARAAAGKETKPPVRIGSGYHTYELVEGWGELPAGMKYGLGCGIVVDSKDRVFVTTKSSNPCVTIFDKHGKLLETWSDDFAQKVGLNADQVAATAHGLFLSKEGRHEYLYWTENINNAKDPKFGARVYKTDLNGKVLYTLGRVKQEDSVSQKFEFTNPTDCAVAPNGDIYVVDGYGSQQVSRFDKNWKHIRTIGQHGKEHGQFNTCHGIWVNTLRRDPEIYIADRANHRIEVFSPALDYKRTVMEGEVRLPCCFYQHRDKMYIPDLASRVTVMDANDKVVAQLGDGKDAKDNQTNPAMFSQPHSASVDSKGNLYVVEYLSFGRPRKFKHTPQTV